MTAHVRRAIAAASLALSLWPDLRAAAHPALGDLVGHRETLVVGPANIDLTVELTFNEQRSLAERVRMDADGDGDISGDEAVAYAAAAADRAAAAIELSIDDERVELILLHEPELDLLGMTRALPVRHVLRLCLFARTPASLKPGGRLLLTDRSWPEAPAFCALQVQGRDGVRLAAGAADALPTPGFGESSRAMAARCLAVPAEVGRPTYLPESPSDAALTPPGHTFMRPSALLPAGLLAAAALTWRYLYRGVRP